MTTTHDDGLEGRKMTPTEQRVSDAVQLAIERFGNAIKDDIREMFDAKLAEFDSKYRTCATCDVTHKSVDDRLKKAEQMLFWGVTSAVVGTLGALFSLAMFVANLLAARQ